MSYNCLLLDLDETLVSFKESEKQAILRLYAKYGIPDTDENREYYHELNKDLWTDLKDGKLRKPELEKARFNTLIEKFDIKNVKADQLSVRDRQVDIPEDCFIVSFFIYYERQIFQF